MEVLKLFLQHQDVVSSCQEENLKKAETRFWYKTQTQPAWWGGVTLTFDLVNKNNRRACGPVGTAPTLRPLHPDGGRFL